MRLYGLLLRLYPTSFRNEYGAEMRAIGAYVVGRTLESLLAGVSPADPLVYGASIALVLVATLLGTAAPAIRAARIDPLAAIRAE